MDITTLTAYRKIMIKEQKMMNKWAKEAEAREALRPKDPWELEIAEMERTKKVGIALSGRLLIGGGPGVVF